LNTNVLEAILADENFPQSMKNLIQRGLPMTTPDKPYIRHCTDRYVILSEVDSLNRQMGDYMLGSSSSLHFARNGDWVVVVHTDSRVATKYTLIPALLKTAGFNNRSHDDGTLLKNRLDENKVYHLKSGSTENKFDQTFDFCAGSRWA
jgi:hypothetical protein